MFLSIFPRMWYKEDRLPHIKRINRAAGKGETKGMKDYLLWEDKPAENFCDAHYLGNGRLGMSVMGGSAAGRGLHQRRHSLVGQRGILSESSAL